MTNLTELERTVLDDITKDDFYENGLYSEIWADCFMDTVTVPTKIARGVLSSLIQKDIIRPIERGRDGVIAFTEHGISVMRELGYK